MIEVANHSKIEILRQQIKKMVDEKPGKAGSQPHEIEAMKLTQEIAVQQM